MRLLIILIFLMMSNCVSAPVKHSNPDMDTCFLVIGKYEAIPICIPKGAWDIGDDERGYPIFNSYDEMVEYYTKLAEEHKKRQGTHI